MICTSKTQAERIAIAGAARMAGQGYTLVQSPSNPSVYRCYKPAGEGLYRDYYRVEMEPMPVTCSCAFFRENAQYKVCKHIAYARAEREAEEYCVAHGLQIVANFAVATKGVNGVNGANVANGAASGAG